MSIRSAVLKLWHNGRVLLRRHYRQGVDWNLKSEKILGKLSGEARAAQGRTSGSLAPQSFVQSQYESARKIFVDNILRRVTNSLSGDLRKKTTKQLLFGNSTPFFALVGVSLASGTGIITKEDELEGVCWEIRDAVARMQRSLSEAGSDVFSDDETVTLNKFVVGPPIAKGTNAVVYAARKNQGNENDGESSSESVIISVEEPLKNFPFALKMMFNYDIESNAFSIMRGMSREIVPAKACFGLDLMELCLDNDFVQLESHPNVVSVHCVFADIVVDLPASASLYPQALPPRINPETGLARNMSLFLLMKRYDMTLTQYIREGRVSTRDGILLLAQLLEAVAFLNSNEVAHRDLKSDNILLDVTEDECPVLVVTDFGCCLTGGLTLPFRTLDTDRGGNAALMAPEVVNAEPGLFSSIDYSKSDCWAAGAIAYEIFTGRNPFYRGVDRMPPLRSSRYTVDQLPDLMEHGVPRLVAHLITEIMNPNPKKRPSAELAATILQVFLWAPSSWQQEYPVPSNSELLQWLLCLTTKVLCGGYSLGKESSRRSDTEYLLIGSLLRRSRLSTIRQALHWIQSNAQI